MCTRRRELLLLPPCLEGMSRDGAATENSLPWGKRSWQAGTLPHGGGEGGGLQRYDHGEPLESEWTNKKRAEYK